MISEKETGFHLIFQSFLTGKKCALYMSKYGSEKLWTFFCDNLSFVMIIMRKKALCQLATSYLKGKNFEVLKLIPFSFLQSKLATLFSSPDDSEKQPF